MNAGTRDAILKQAERYVQQGDTASALAEYRKILRASPRDVTVANTVGDLNARLGNTADAIKHYVDVAGIYESQDLLSLAAAVYKKIAKLDPSNVDAAVRLGGLYAKQGLMVEATQQYLTVADLHRKAGRSRDAVHTLEQIASLDSGNPRTLLSVARVLEREGLTHEAASAYRTAGQSFLRMGRGEESVKALTTSLALDPDSRGTLKALAEAHANVGNVTAALEVVARALESEPNSVDLIIILGRTFLSAGMLDRAEGAFERLFRLDNSRYVYLLEVATAYVERGEYERTLGILDQCIDVILARRQKKRATAILKSILERDPGNIHALKRLAAIYRNVRERRNLTTTLNTIVKAALEQGYRAEAITALRQLVEIEPKKKAWQEQLASIDTGEEEVSLLAPDETLDDGYDSYGDYSTELLAEMVAQHPEFLEARLKLLEELVAQQPSYVDGRLRLKQLYLDDDRREKAAEQCVELARIYDEQGQAETAERYRREAETLAPSSRVAVAVAPEPAPAIRLSGLSGVEELGERLDEEWRRVTGEQRPLSLVMAAVDDFDAVERNHDAAESLRYLERIAAVLADQLASRAHVLATTGAEAFFALLPEVHPGAANAVAEAMRRGVETLDLAAGAGKVTISAAVATAFPYRAGTPDELLAAVERACATARASGGNRVVTVPLLA